MESEYMALTEATQEVKYLREFMSSLGFDPSGPTTIYEDNQSCIKFISNHKFSARSKHIDVKRHYTEDAVTNQQIKVTYVQSQDNLADIMTKPLPPVKFGKLRDALTSAT